MATDNIDTMGPRLPWAGKKVHPQNVEEELSFLWRMSSDNVRTSQNINVRTSVLNLVICAPDIDSAQRASKLMRNLLSTHIARFTLLVLDSRSDVPSGVSTWVTLRSFPIISDVMRHNFEQVTLIVSGEAVNSAASIVQPLLKPDLPIYLMWLNDPPQDNPAFTDLVRLSTRVVVDSHTFFHAEEGIRILSSFMQQEADSAISDLNWGRVTPWRELVAQFFDVTEYRPYLAGVHSIEIEHAATPEGGHIRTELGDVSPDPIEALLLAGWLKTVLNWKLAGNSSSNLIDSATGTYTWRIARPTGALPLPTSDMSRGTTGRLLTHEEGNISIRPRVQSNLRPGNICLVRLTSDMDQKHAVFSLNRGDDTELVYTSVELPEGTKSQRTVQIPAASSPIELLHDELEIMGRDHLYEDTLHEVTRLLEF
ncbi:MAG: glucose-6-phosphate dehydrogenase assembly protein OpcA [Ktedonobacteraceae bacterium]|nr:glucose-6-phosphate dehydrogenase assembly protein OpcA [Ktedonobacteraceae bacterium]MBV9712212.1 glucose-6-phosphate dehydrogenase assembly protein OpcA [Ktedonobacteraceae bacterium]